MLTCPNCNHRWSEKQAEKEENSPKELGELWNATLGDKLPKVLAMTDGRKTKCRLRLKDRPLSEWKKVFEKMASTPFLVGQSKTSWKASFDWIISNQDNALKVLEGVYDGKAGQNQAGIVGEAKPKPGQYAGF